jgi:hypothetical protein
VSWENATSPTLGWNDLDTLDVGDGTADGLTDTEKRTAVTIWAMANSPLYLGGDLTQLDALAKSAFTNDELLAVDQSGHPAIQKTGGFHPVWVADAGDGDYYVALYNFTAFQGRVDVPWRDLGFKDVIAVRDIWNHTDLGAFPGDFSTLVPGHGARLLKVTPLGEIEHPPVGVSYQAASATLTGSAAPATCPTCSGGVKVGNIGGASEVIFNNVSVRESGIYRMQIDAMTQGPRTLEYSVNGAASQSLNMGGGSYLLPQSSTVPVALNRGNNTVAFLNPSGYGADLDRIVISGDGKEPAPTFTTYEAEGAQLAGTAGFNYSTRASGGAYVGSFGAGPANTITFNNVTAPVNGTYQLEIDYVTDGPRTVYVSINGATPLQLTFNGNNWYDPVPYVLPVQLLGGTNTIVFSNPNPSGYAPGIDVIIVSTGANIAPRITSGDNNPGKRE